MFTRIDGRLTDLPLPPTTETLVIKAVLYGYKLRCEHPMLNDGEVKDEAAKWFSEELKKL